MRSNYKSLGDYIQQVNIRNTDLDIDTHLGVSIDKVMIPTIANTVGTNMSTYKVIERNQFAYGPVTSRNGEKVSIALMQDHDKAIISQAYTVFKVNDENKLDPEYLMMWFRRPEFDRYARFKSHGSAREVFDWEEMANVELPVPAIERQKEIVKEYNTVTGRIRLNEQINKKLEETAQAIYKHWFEDFEFPWDFRRGEPSLQGQPYKSGGGAMVWNDELGKEIPKGWGVVELGEVIESYSKSHKFNKNKLVFLNTSDIFDGDIVMSNYQDVNELPGQAKKQVKLNDILFSEIRPKNKRYAFIRIKADDFVVSTKLMVIRSRNEAFSQERIYSFLTNPDFIEILHISAEGRSGTFPQITFDGDLKDKLFTFGTQEVELMWNNLLKFVFINIFSRKDENKYLDKFQNLNLSRMSN